MTDVADDLLDNGIDVTGLSLHPWRETVVVTSQGAEVLHTRLQSAAAGPEHLRKRRGVLLKGLAQGAQDGPNRGQALLDIVVHPAGQGARRGAPLGFTPPGRDGPGAI